MSLEIEVYFPKGIIIGSEEEMKIYLHFDRANQLYRRRRYILSFLYFIREQIIFVIISSKDKQEVLSLSFITRYRYP